jgi:hypothetical protein
MQKRAIVLLITLFFISAISILILKNLNDSEQFIQEVSCDTTLTQLKLTSTNIQDEIVNLINKNKNNIDSILEITSSGIPFGYGNINLSLILEQYFIPECYLNDINYTNNVNKQCGDDIANEILYPYDFVTILSKYKPISNQQQIDYFIRDYQYQTKDDEINDIKEQFGFIKQDINETIYLKCSYNIVVQNSDASSNFIFKLDGNNTVVSFDFSLR